MGKFVDLTGVTFNNLYVIEYAGKAKSGHSMWLCRCKCKKEKVFKGVDITSGAIKSCGCLRKEDKIIDLTNQIFGRLKVINPAGRDKHGYALWLCLCNCGTDEFTKEHTVTGYSLRHGKSKSCGCWRKEAPTVQKRIHGKQPRRLYAIWQEMKCRCYNPNRGVNMYYMDKGITVCDEWVNDYIPFKDWALTNGYSDEKQIDRKDSNLGYNPNNCQWLTPSGHGRKTREDNPKIKRGKPE